ncbi:MAG: ABC transporter ATP-binding protein [Chloroflexi bacterium]|nr:ABC transporter ATP-binding protein [Chloroflexota bacterium]
MTASYLQIRGLRKSYGHEQAVRGITLGVEQGEVLTLLGPSGCGKTTTLRCVAGLEEPDDGEILVGDDVLTSVPRRIVLPPERRQLGMVFQSYAVWPHMSVAQNVAYPLEVRHVPRTEIKQRVAEVLELVGLGGLEQRNATRLSGGQQQRIALARALVARPRLLLFDEPLSNLDAQLRERMRLEIVHLLRELHITAVYVTHDQAEAMVVSDTIAVMSHGRVEQIGAPEEIYAWPRSAFVASFLGRANLLPATSLSEPDPSGRVRLRLAGDGASLELLGTLPSGGVPAERYAVAIKPECIAFLPNAAAADGTNVFPARVVEAVNQGNLMEYQVAMGEGSAIMLRAQGPSSTPWPASADVSLRIEPAHCVCVPADGERE